MEVRIPSGNGYRFEDEDGSGFQFDDKFEGFRFDAVQIEGSWHYAKALEEFICLRNILHTGTLAVTDKKHEILVVRYSKDRLYVSRGVLSNLLNSRF